MSNTLVRIPPVDAEVIANYPVNRNDHILLLSLKLQEKVGEAILAERDMALTDAITDVVDAALSLFARVTGESPELILNRYADRQAAQRTYLEASYVRVPD